MVDDEAELVQSCLAGDEAGLRSFVERFQGMIFGLCVRMVGHRHDAEDLAQESLLRALRNLRQWDPTKPLRPWLLTIAANRCRTLLSTRPRRAAAPVLADIVDVSPPAANTDLAEELQLALAHLREEYRLCFVLHYQNGMSLQEIGVIAGCPASTVKTWLFRARRELAEFLQRRGVVPQMQHDTGAT